MEVIVANDLYYRKKIFTIIIAVTFMNIFLRCGADRRVVSMLAD